MKDIQNEYDSRGIDIQKVGIKNFDIPLKIKRKSNSNQVVNALADVSVLLPKHYKGTHMSRFIEILTEWQHKDMLGSDLKGCIESVIKKMSANSGELHLEFKYFIDKIAPISKQASPLCYDCSFTSILSDFGTENEKYKFILGVKVPVITLCPCSKEISDYGAHNQRTIVSVKVSYDRNEHIWIEDLIKDIEECASCDIYSLLKREDEKFVTEKAYDNPKFVEDVLRDVVLMLRNNHIVKEFEIECESLESIHNHSAWAYQKEIKDV
ncbi:GTP cyclohydrolase I FolE2 [bacterium]|nr:GTP cyclohydrolase I FolE2 [bacterium]